LPGALRSKPSKAAWGDLPTTRLALGRDSRFLQEFIRQEERVTPMEFRVVALADDFESYVFEPYAAMMPDTSYNSWATS
jgi:hypothetical protein